MAGVRITMQEIVRHGRNMMTLLVLLGTRAARTYTLFGFRLLPWEVPLLPWKLASTSIETSTYLHGSKFYFRKVCLLRRKFAWRLIPLTSTEVNQLPWTLPPTSMEVDFLSFASTEVASFTSFIQQLHLLPLKLQYTSIYFHGSFHQPPCKLPASKQVAPASMEATYYFDVLPSTSTEIGSKATVH